MSVPDPSTTDWVPLWSLGSYGALPADTVIPAATRIITSKFLAGDTQPAWRIMGDGKQEWGPGGTTAPDTNLYRSAVDTLKTDDNLVVGGTITAVGRIFTGAAASGGIWVDGSAGTQFIGSADSTRIGFYNGGSYQMWVGSTGRIEIGSSDVYLYRGAAANLFIENTLRINGVLVTGQGGGNGYIYWGGALDTQLWRRGAGSLQTNGNFTAGTELYSRVDSGEQTAIGNFRGVPEIMFGNANNCSLYRESAGANVINCYSGAGAWGTFKAAAFAVQSDRSTKSDIVPVDVPVDRLLNAGVYTYERVKEGGRHLGLIADELPEEILDDAITPEGDTFQFVDLYKLSTALLATVQHLDERLKALEGVK